MNVLKDIIKNQKIKYVILFILTIVKSIFAILLAIILQRLIDSLNVTSINEIVADIMCIIIYISVLVTINLIYSYYSANITKKILVELKKNVISNILRQNLAEISKVNSAIYISLLTNHIDDIEKDYLNSIVNIMDMFITLIFSAVALIYLNPLIGFVAIISSFLSLLAPVYLSGKGEQLRAEYSKQQEKATKYTEDLLHGFELIKGYGVEKKVLQEYQKIAYDVESSRYSFNFTIGALKGISMFMGYMVFFAVVITGLILSLNTFISIGVLVACINLSNGLVNPIMNGIQEIFKYKSTTTIIEKFNLRCEYNAPADIAIKSLNEGITLRNVNYLYDTKKGIKDINLNICKGKKYAIVGTSGSGKSTLLRIIMGQYRNYQGQIFYDTADLSDIDENSLCKIYSVVNQHPFLFDTSIKENVIFYQDIDDNILNEVIRKVGLEEFISSRKENIQSNVGEDGNQVSGGEKQRIAIARALARGHDIIFLDEATSNLDNNTALKIEQILLKSNKTIISATHRLLKEALVQYDMIVVMNEGKIIETGSFEELIGKQGLFYSLYYLDNI